MEALVLPVREGVCVIWPPGLPVMWGIVLESNYMCDGSLFAHVILAYLHEHLWPRAMTANKCNLSSDVLMFMFLSCSNPSNLIISKSSFLWISLSWIPVHICTLELILALACEGFPMHDGGVLSTALITSLWSGWISICLAITPVPFWADPHCASELDTHRLNGPAKLWSY